MPSRRSNLRLTQKDIAKIRTLVKKFNAKVTRVSKRNPAIADIQPDKLKTKELVSYFKEQNSRQEFNRKMAQYSRYLENGQELPRLTLGGFNVTEWLFKEIDRSIKADNRRIARKAKINPDVTTDTPYRKNRTDTIAEKKFKAYAEQVDRRLTPAYNQKLNDIYYNNIMNKYKSMFGENSRVYRRVSKMDKEDFIYESTHNRKLSLEYTYEQMRSSEIEQDIWDELDRIDAPEIEDAEAPFDGLIFDDDEDEGFLDTSIIRRPQPKGL